MEGQDENIESENEKETKSLLEKSAAMMERHRLLNEQLDKTKKESEKILANKKEEVK